MKRSFIPAPPRPLSAEHRREGRNFQGIPGIEVTKNGRIWCVWYASSQLGNEGPDNYVVLATSTDNGQNWREVMEIDPPDNIRAYDATLWIDPQNRLWLIWSQTESTGNGDTFDGYAGVFRAIADDPETDCPEWREIERIADGVMMNKPTVGSNGEWYFPTAYWQAASLEKIPEQKRPQAFPNITVTKDRGETFELRIGPAVERRSFDEHMIVERKNGVLWMLTRTYYGIAQSVSCDKGLTWQASQNSGLGGPDSRFAIRRLKSGRLLLINHRTEHLLSGDKTSFRQRNLLTAWLSDDDGQSWHGGLMIDERDNVSYPDLKEANDGFIYVVYDHERYRGGDILIARFREADVEAGKQLSPGSMFRLMVSSYAKKK